MSLLLGWMGCLGWLTGGDEDPKGPAGDDASGTSPTAPACVGDGFSAGVDTWSLPAGYPDGSFDTLADSASDGLGWAVFDLDGRGGLDLVVSETDTDRGVGTTRWLAYLGGESGFGPAATEWSLPDGYTDGSFTTFSGDDDGFVWGLVDMDGDRAPDLVVADADADPDVGTDHWLVYLNGGDGFGPGATEWALPAGYPGRPFAHLADVDSADDVAWALLALDADRAPDLVVTASDAAAEVGQRHWLVYPGGGAGFGPSAVEWGLPDGYVGGTFDRSYDAHRDATDWALLDVDDGGLDVVVVRSDADGSVGGDHWLLYPNTGDAFGPGTDWGLPSGYAARTFETVADADAGDGLGWGVLDLDGDDPLDLVIATSDSLADLGTTRWLLYRGGTDGFGPAADDWSLPTGFTDGTFAGLADTTDPAVVWGLVGLDADDLPDLVIAANRADSAVGVDHWQVARGVCR